MEVGTPQNITSSAGTILFNDFEGAGLGLPDGVGYLNQSVIGLECPGIRNPNDNRPGKSGGHLHPFFKATKLIVIEGLVIADKPWHRTILDDHLRAVTEPGLKEDITYTWSLPPAPYSTTRFHTVRLYGAIEIRGYIQTFVGTTAAPKLYHIEMIAYNLNVEAGY